MMVTTFNEPMSLVGSDFMSRWQQLGGPGMEGQEIIRPATPIVPSNIHSALTNVSHVDFNDDDDDDDVDDDVGNVIDIQVCSYCWSSR